MTAIKVTPLYCSSLYTTNTSILLSRRHSEYTGSMKTRLRLKEVAQQKNISLTRLSQRSEVAYNTVRRLWRDPYADVTLSTLQRLADVLGVDVHELIESVPDNK